MCRYTCINVYDMFTFMLIITHMHVCTLYICMYIVHVYIYMYTCTYIYMHLHMCIFCIDYIYDIWHIFLSDLRTPSMNI